MIENETMEMKLEEAMKRLDEVVSLLEREGADLEESLRLYEEGVRLVALCTAKLSDAERKIRLLRVNADGELCEEPFAEQ
jgi:exodeoxyribonuclease VII small subunit